MTGLTRRAALTLASLPLVAACAPGARPGAPAAATKAAPTVAAAANPALVYVFANDSPHISVIDAATNKVTRTKDVPALSKWSWNDDNNYFDGKNLWLNVRNPDTEDVEVFLLDLDNLEVTHRIALGKDKTTPFGSFLYIGKPSRRGLVLVSKHASGQVAVIDPKTYQVVEYKDVPVNGGFACDMDVATGPDGVERAFIPTWTGDTIISIDTGSREVLQTLPVPKDSSPWMLTAARDGRSVWVQEGGTNTVAVLDPVALQVIKRLPTGKQPLINTFSPDGKLSYITHAGDTKLIVVDTGTYQVVKEIEVGANPQEVAAHPNGRVIYSTVSKENAVAAIDTATWQVTQRIDLGIGPSSIFFRPLA